MRKRHYTSPIERRVRAAYIQSIPAILAVLAVWLGIWACARWVGVDGRSALMAAVGTLFLMLLCNLRWPVLAKLRDNHIYGVVADSAATDLVERKLRSNWFLILCCAAALLWALGFAAFLAGEDGYARFLWAVPVVLQTWAAVVLRRTAYPLPRSARAS